MIQKANSLKIRSSECKDPGAYSRSRKKVSVTGTWSGKKKGVRKEFGN